MATKKKSPEELREIAERAAQMGAKVSLPQAGDKPAIAAPPIPVVPPPPPKRDKDGKPTMDDIVWLMHALGRETPPKLEDFPSKAIVGMYKAITSDDQLKAKFWLGVFDMVQPTKKDVNSNDRYADKNKSLTRIYSEVATASTESPLLSSSA